MAFITYNNVGIRAVSACVPSKIIYNKDLGYLIPEEEIEKTINAIGIRERRISDDNTCSSDLCFKAAKKLMEDNGIVANTIDVLLFLSQTPDYKTPATAPLLQNRLGLPNTTASMDLNLACSGYVYGLSTAFAYASQQGINRVLLLVGETFSKITSAYDKVNWPLYGDAGTATLIEKGDYCDSHFELMTDGSGSKALIIPAGECRNPATAENLQITEREDGNRRSDHQIYMDGMDVFNFTLRVVPKSIKNMLAALSIQADDIDYFLFHQANRFMIDFIVKKLKIDAEKVPFCIDRFGNTSSASIPLTIVSELGNKKRANEKVILCGFGAGLSWGTAYTEFNNCAVSPLIEY
ncbi:MAG: ketoacyl-ACP synthase III [Treponema sp.]|jgi:3-oxoacyl-[acyl-carrier-protein] synthase-3|nr:ketoacyl-ACP synthase III [Treponema sp.]